MGDYSQFDSVTLRHVRRIEAMIQEMERTARAFGDSVARTGKIADEFQLKQDLRRQGK